MDARLEDRVAITDLMVGWVHRDQAEWDQLRELFHPEATIEVTWFEGPAGDFIDGSMKMGASDLRSKHLVSPPTITFRGDRALTITNAMIVVENAKIDLAATAHSRLLDRVEKRDGVWRLVSRQCIYDTCHFNFLGNAEGIDAQIVRRYPREYAALGYLLEKSGFPVTRVFPTKGSELEIQMKAAGTAWLNELADTQ